MQLARRTSTAPWSTSTAAGLPWPSSPP